MDNQSEIEEILRSEKQAIELERTNRRKSLQLAALPLFLIVVFFMAYMAISVEAWLIAFLLVAITAYIVLRVLLDKKHNRAEKPKPVSIWFWVFLVISAPITHYLVQWFYGI